MSQANIDNPFKYNNERLILTAKKVRRSIITMNSQTGGGHTGADLSETDILVTLYFSILRYTIDFAHPLRDRFILSKGHGAGGFYCTLAEAGLIDKKLLSTYLTFDSRLQGHPVRHKLFPIELNTGALGHGLPVSVGLALSAKMMKKDFNVYVLVGDGELQEGSNWEAAMSASTFKLDNLIVIVDRNGLQLANKTEEIMKLEPLEEKFKSFGFRVLSANGNDPSSLVSGIQLTQKEPTEKPTAIIAHTTKGKGISFIENNPQWHHRIPKGNEIAQAMQELE